MLIEKRQFIPLKDRAVWCVLGLAFDVVSLDDATLAIVKAINEHRRCFLTTPNLNFVVQAQFDGAFFDSVINSNLVVADGMPIVWVARLLGIPITQRVAGSTLFDELSKQENRKNKIKVFFFGGQKGVAELAHKTLNETSVAMVACGFYDPGFVSVDAMSSPEIIARINDADPDFLVVALGAKKGQQWIQQNRDRLNARVISHLGAVINFVAGNVDRAPDSWQRWGGEWLWRIKQEPELWRRYFFDGLAFCKLLVCNVFPLALYDRFLQRTADFHDRAGIQLDKADDIVISLSGSVHDGCLNDVKQVFDAMLQQEKHDIVLNCTQLKYVDAAFIASLLLFQRYLNEQKRQLLLHDVSPRIKRLLYLHHVLTRFQIE